MSTPRRAARSAKARASVKPSTPPSESPAPSSDTPSVVNNDTPSTNPSPKPVSDPRFQLALGDDSDEDGEQGSAGSDEDEAEASYLRRKPVSAGAGVGSGSEDEADSDAEQERAEDEAADDEQVQEEDDPNNVTSAETLVRSTRIRKAAPLSAKALARFEAKQKASGVVYLSRIPPFMRPVKLRQLLSRYGQLGRLYLAAEDAKTAARRAKYRHNRRVNYTEGWVEFLDKSVARATAQHLNGTTIGGKKRSFYYDDLWNVKYLPKFKWNDLTDQIAYELKVRDQKLRTEMQLAKRETQAYVKNVGRAKMVAALEDKRAKKRKAAEELDAGGSGSGSGAAPSAATTASAGQPGVGAAADPTRAIRRQFKQRKVIDTGSSAGGAAPVPSGKKAAMLSKLFG
ncbi:Activator of basal transcription 1 [Thoreauomyces humboldtii]|nr:Activator of basal transcription 1 [Thoreauomyces humboldtii]